MSRVIIAMLAMTGRVTMLGLSRWAGEGGSYRTIQRFYKTVIPWAEVFWQLFRHSLFQKDRVYILAGENVAGPSVLLLSGADLDNAAPEEWQALGAQAVISTQPEAWVIPPNGRRVYLSTDGVRMWVDVEK